MGGENSKSKSASCYGVSRVANFSGWEDFLNTWKTLDGPEGCTIRELCEFSGRSRAWVYAKVAELVRKGEVIVGYGHRPSIVPGRDAAVPVYKLTKGGPHS